MYSPSSIAWIIIRSCNERIVGSRAQAKHCTRDVIPNWSLLHSILVRLLFRFSRKTRGSLLWANFVVRNLPREPTPLVFPARSNARSRARISVARRWRIERDVTQTAAFHCSVIDSSSTRHVIPSLPLLGQCISHRQGSPPVGQQQTQDGPRQQQQQQPPEKYCCWNALHLHDSSRIVVGFRATILREERRIHLLLAPHLRQQQC